MAMVQIVATVLFVRVVVAAVVVTAVRVTVPVTVSVLTMYLFGEGLGQFRPYEIGIQGL